MLLIVNNMKNEIPLKAQVLLDPISKYKIYGVFPWILFIHVLTVILDSTILLEINDVSGDLLRS
jgi:hypothetical protein